jgi:hypothetical protein
MAKRTKQQISSKSQKLKRNLIWISLIILFMKLILIFSIRYGGWMGSDTESYFPGAVALLKDGFFSKDSVLSYLPAGYPITIWILALFTGTGSFITEASSVIVISIFQTIFYFGACAFFVEKIRRTRLSSLAMPTAFLLGINPTLSLSSLLVGYESIVASCTLLSVALIIDFQQSKPQRSLGRTLIFVGLLQSFAGFMQPRVLLIGFVLLSLWGFFQHSRKSLAIILVVGSCVMAVLPLLLVFRNVEATGTAVLSSQLGGAMSGGAGDTATGGLTGSAHVGCPIKIPPVAVSDSELVVCVLDWYVHHPVKTIHLAINKTVYFWSPWSGPLANGTAGRNPWLKIDPVQNIVSTAGGHALVFGWFGKVISWIWLLGGILLLGVGFVWLWKQGTLEREISLLTAVPIFLATLTSVGTIGDHRYRIPIMGLSLFLQVVGVFALKEHFSKVKTPPALVSRARAR